MDFVSTVFFLILQYIRPQEWISLVAKLQPVKITVAMAILSMIMRGRGLSWRDFLKTPHDWLILLIFVWIVITAPDSWNTFTLVYPLYIFYTVTVQCLSTMWRIRTMLNWWTALIFILAALGVLSIYGFDPMGGHDLVNDRMKGRLIVNTSIFNNPNALGHAIVPVILMLYYSVCWKRPIFMKIATIPAVLLPMYCIYLTQSKGAFLSSFASVLGGMIFGRPKTVQILLLSVGLTIGVTAIYTLPRMGELDKAASDGAIQGRVAAFQYGLTILKGNIRGVGYENFRYNFRRTHHYGKAPHSAYNQIGAELGLPGFTLFIGILVVSLRSLWQAKTRDIEEERARRILFVMLISYAVSSWMVDFAYRGTFFMMVATIAAFHRLMLPEKKPVVEKKKDDERLEFTPAHAAFAQMQLATPSPVSATAGFPVFESVAKPVVAGPGALSAQPEVVDVESMEIYTKPPGLLWERLGWLDAALIAAATYGAIRFWTYIMHHINRA